ncbi:MAG: hypothetical protein OQK51_19515, partial [Kangiellaceae bacterium]|nr:hypothetical protein [Kangiellaceae bacterium]
IHSVDGEIEELLRNLSDPRVSEKLVATMIDESIEIRVEVESQNQTYVKSELRDFKDESVENQLFYVKYNSEIEDVEIYHRGEHILSTPFKLERSDYALDIELVIFFFGQGKNSKSISALNRRIHDDALYPLVYVNNNLFNNTLVFDPELLRKKRTDETLPQMIGRVCIFSQSQELDFNSDRTNFVENRFTKSLESDLKKLNTLIQMKGAELKKRLKEESSKNVVPVGPAVPREGSKKDKEKVASISIDNSIPTTYYIPSGQIDLDSFIFLVKNSLGEEVKKYEVDIEIDGCSSSSRVLASVASECEKSIRFSYIDKRTGYVSKEVQLLFKQKRATITGKLQEKSLFTIPTNSNYCIVLETVADIIYAIDKAYSSRDKELYLPLIACSIRSIFEISADKVKKVRRSWIKMLDKSKLVSNVKREVKDSLFKDVALIIILLKKNQKLLTEIAYATKISFSTLNNLLDLVDFRRAVKASHIAAHQSTRYLSKPKIEESADVCGRFAVICDVLINLEDDTVSSISISSVDESDLNRYLG